MQTIETTDFLLASTREPGINEDRISRIFESHFPDETNEGKHWENSNCDLNHSENIESLRMQSNLNILSVTKMTAYQFI